MAADDDRAEADPRGEPPVPAALNADAFCTGLWERAAGRASTWLTAAALAPLARPTAPHDDVRSAARELGVDTVRVDAISRWSAAFQTVRTEVASDDAVTRLVTAHELDWTTVEFDEMTFARRSAASEALLCCRDDGLEPEEVMARSGGRLSARSSRIDTLPAPVAAGCMATDIEGRAIGPFETADGWSVLRLSARRRPDPVDPDVRASAVDELLDGALEGEIARGMRWIGPV